MTFRDFILYESLHDNLVAKYKSYIDEFIELNPNPELETPYCNNCGIVSGDLRNFLRSKGLKANMINANGFKGKFGDDHHPQYKDQQPDREYMYHLVVELPDAIIDLTGRQFGKQYGGARILTLDDFSQEWNKVNTGGDLPAWEDD